MARLFPFRSDPATEDGTPRIVGLEGEDADAVFSALSSTTAREIYARLDEEPGTPSDVADAIDSSIQNVRYHLEKLEDAGLVQVVDTWYSSRGNEMSVYATTDGPLIVTGDESTATQLKTALSRLLGGVGALAAGSLLVQYGLTRQFDITEAGSPPPADDGDRAADDGNGDEPDPMEADDRQFDAETADDDVADDTADEPPEDDAADEEPSEVDESEDAADDEPVEEEDVAEDFDDAPDAGDDATYLDQDSGDSVGNVTDGGVEAAETVFATVPPGLLFFLGGLVVLLAISAHWYWSQPDY